MKFDVCNRWTGAVQFTAEIDCEVDTSNGFKIGLAVRWAKKSGADLRDADLRGAFLSGAYLSGADLSGAYLSRADLRDADLRGADLRRADLSGPDLSGGADLSSADLRDADLRGAFLSGAFLSGAYLSGADLSGADLSDANLSGAYLSNANLSGAEIPVIENIDAAILAAIEADGNSLDMRDWHHCETSHCRAGWAIHLAGEAGYALERKVGPAGAGALIYARSRPDKPVPDFYCGNEAALSDIRASATANH